VRQKEKEANQMVANQISALELRHEDFKREKEERRRKKNI